MPIEKFLSGRKGQLNGQAKEEGEKKRAGTVECCR